MKIRRSIVSMIALAAVVALGSAASAQSLGTKDGGKNGRSSTKAVAKIGEKAPDFKLMDANGKAHTLTDYSGKIVVLQWINPKCPVCVRCTSNGDVGRMIEATKKQSKDVVFLAVNSSHFAEPMSSAKYLKEHKIDWPALSDKDGKVGRMYGARTTPHVFVIDAEGVLRYEGAIDDARSKDKAGTNYVVNAVTQIVAGDTVSPDRTRSYGCSVKYKK